MLARAEAERVYGAARESHDEHTRNTLKHSTCSHKLCETLKDQIFGEKPSIPALPGPGCGLVVTPVEKGSLLASQFDSKHCREQFITPLSRFPRSRCNSLAFQTSVLMHLLLGLDTYMGIPSISKESCGYYCSKTKHNLSYAHPSIIVSGVLEVCKCNCHSQGCSVP